MLRYRTHDALRTKSTLLMSSNRLFLIYQNYMQWSDYMSRQATNGVTAWADSSVSEQSGLRAAVVNGTPQDISMLNTIFFINNWSVVQQYASFVFRYLNLSDSVTGAPVFKITTGLSTDTFEQYDVAASNIAINTWLLFYNIERYVLLSNSAWNSQYLVRPEIFST
jgi:hypothetical protein